MLKPRTLRSMLYLGAAVFATSLLTGCLYVHDGPHPRHHRSRTKVDVHHHHHHHKKVVPPKHARRPSYGKRYGSVHQPPKHQPRYGGWDDRDRGRDNRPRNTSQRR
jgi:hypothetical protein